MTENVVQALFERAGRAKAMLDAHRGLALGAATAVAAASTVVIALVPERYEAVAQVYVDTQTVLKPLMAGLTYPPDIDQQVRLLASTLITRPNLERLARTPHLQLGAISDAERERLVAQWMTRIRISGSGSSNLYAISYRGASPAEARALVQATVDLFVTSGTGEKQRDVQDAGRFIDEQILTYESKLLEAEARLKAFKLRNFGVSGVSNQDSFARVSALGDEVARLRIEMTAAERSRDSLRKELASEDPLLPIDPSLAAGAPLASDPQVRLAEQKRQLDELSRRFTPAHPDVLGAQQAVARLEAEVAERRAADARNGIKAGRAATSPIYQRLRVSLAEAEAQIAALRAQLAAQLDRLEQARALAGRLPQVEADLVQLNRDYEVIRKNYDQMVARRESASLGARLDASTQLADFRLIEPPRAESVPVPPSRAQLSLLALFASLLAGVAAAVLADLARPTFADAGALRAFIDRPVLGSVTLHLRPGAKAARRSRTLAFALALLALVALQAGWAAWLATRLQPA